MFARFLCPVASLMPLLALSLCGCDSSVELAEDPPAPKAKPIVVQQLETYTNPVGMKFHLIPAGQFAMGSPKEADERPVRQVAITRPFFMGVTEVTQEQYEEVMEDNPSFFEGENLPVERVIWLEAQEFCEKLSELDKTGTYRLPTEAEWEYACRAGSETERYWGAEYQDGYGWYRGNSNNRSRPVAQLKPNAWGLHDMVGNVWEYVQDFYVKPYPEGPATDPAGPPTGTYRAIRGGSWFTRSHSLRSANRHKRSALRAEEDTGFRVVYEPTK